MSWYILKWRGFWSKLSPFDKVQFSCFMTFIGSFLTALISVVTGLCLQNWAAAIFVLLGIVGMIGSGFVSDQYN